MKNLNASAGREIELDLHKYLVFSMGDELFATSIIDATEVGVPIKPKTLPNMVDHFMGLINLRGKVIGMIDLRKKFDLPVAENNAYNMMIVFECNSGAFAVVVDRVISVQNIAPERIDRKVKISSKVQMQYILGIAQTDRDLVTILNMKNLLDDEDIVSYRRAVANS